MGKTGETEGYYGCVEETNRFVFGNTVFNLFINVYLTVVLYQYWKLDGVQNKCRLCGGRDRDVIDRPVDKFDQVAQAQMQQYPPMYQNQYPYQPQASPTKIYTKDIEQMLDALVTSNAMPQSKTDEYIAVFTRQNIQTRADFYKCDKNRVIELASACGMGIGSKNALISEWQKKNNNLPEERPSGNQVEVLPSGNQAEALPSGGGSANNLPMEIE